MLPNDHALLFTPNTDCSTGLSDPSSKVQASSLNMLNMALANPDLATRHRTAIQEERGLLPALAAALDHSLPLLRAKAAVSVLLLCRGVLLVGSCHSINTLRSRQESRIKLPVASDY